MKGNSANINNIVQQMAKELSHLSSFLSQNLCTSDVLMEYTIYAECFIYNFQQLFLVQLFDLTSVQHFYEVLLTVYTLNSNLISCLGGCVNRFPKEKTRALCQSRILLSMHLSGSVDPDPRKCGIAQGLRNQWILLTQMWAKKITK